MRRLTIFWITWLIQVISDRLGHFGQLWTAKDHFGLKMWSPKIALKILLTTFLRTPYLCTTITLLHVLQMKGRDYIALLSLDGTLSIFEQESHSFSRCPFPPLESTTMTPPIKMFHYHHHQDCHYGQLIITGSCLAFSFLDLLPL